MLDAKDVMYQDGIGRLLAQMGAVCHKRKRTFKKVSNFLLRLVVLA